MGVSRNGKGKPRVCLAGIVGTIAYQPSIFCNK